MNLGVDMEGPSSQSTVDSPAQASRGMQCAYLVMLSPYMVRVALATVTVCATVFTILGPIGMYNTLTPWERITYGLVCSLFCFPICYALSLVAVYLSRSRSPFQVGLAAAVVLLFACLPCAAVVYTFQALFYPEHSSEFGFLTLYVMTATATVACHVVFHYVLCQRVKPSTEESRGRSRAGDAQELPARSGDPEAVAVQGSAGAAAGDPAAAPGASTTGDSPPPDTVPQAGAPPAGGEGAPVAVPEAESPKPVSGRIPLYQDEDIVLLKADGRHVHIHTTTGSSRTVARFADFVAELGDRGMQVHRSYWVAYRHMQDLVKRDMYTVLQLTGGHEVPVSRTYLVAARAAMRRTTTT